MLKSFKFWFCIALAVIIIGIVISNLCGVALQIDYLTSVLSVVLSIMITLGLIDRDLPSKTDAESIKHNLLEVQEKLEIDNENNTEIKSDKK